MRLAVTGIVLTSVALLIGTTATVAGLDVRSTDRLQPFAPLSEELVVVGLDLRATAEIENQVTLGAPVAALEADTAGLLVTRLDDAGASAIVLHHEPGSGDDRLRILRIAAREAGNVVMPAAVSDAGTADGRTTGRREASSSADNESLTGAYTAGDAGVGDGRVRTLPLLVDLVEEDGTLLRYPSPMAATALLALGVADGDTTIRQQPGTISIGTHDIPTDGAGQLRIAYAPQLHPGALDRSRTQAIDGVSRTELGEQRAEDVAAFLGLPYLSAVDVTTGSFDPALVKDRIAVIAVTSGLASTAATAIPNSGELTSPAYITLNALNTILTASWLEPATPLERHGWVLLAGLIATLLAAAVPVWIGAPVTVAMSAGYVALVGWRFPRGTVMDTVAPLLALALCYLGVFAVRYLQESAQRRRIATLFGEYVPKAVAERLIADTDRADAASAGERTEVTVMFCDLRGFTSIAGRLAPTDVRDLLNVYYLRAAEVILDTRGTLMQYVGDEVFAVFGVPITPDEDHPGRALRCAAELQAIAGDIAVELADLGIPPIEYGIGVHTGEVVAAHVGDTQRRQYAVVGDAVNVGARLCSLAKAGEVVVSSAVLDRIDHPPATESMPPVELKGVERELHLFRLSPPPPT